MLEKLLKAQKKYLEKLSAVEFLLNKHYPNENIKKYVPYSYNDDEYNSDLSIDI